MSVLVVAFGVGICTITDVEVNTKGLLCACVAVLSTSLQQIVSINILILSSFFFSKIRRNSFRLPNIDLPLEPGRNLDDHVI